MKIEKIILDGQDHNSMIYIYEDGSKETKQYPPFDEADKKIVKEFGGMKQISLDTFRYNRDQDLLNKRFEMFCEGVSSYAVNFTIDSLMSNSLSDEELMKLKLSIFDNEFVKKSKNRDLLTKIRTSKDTIDLIMYFGMLRKENEDDV